MRPLERPAPGGSNVVGRINMCVLIYISMRLNLQMRRGLLLCYGGGGVRGGVDATPWSSSERTLPIARAISRASFCCAITTGFMA
mmetsp:Transcript_4762/g.17292  ORF Transcript_4762/g.17292 Transcript_4762/m.17292 type:complete len:85 (-) Transcript_4762:6560-6814(-)